MDSKFDKSNIRATELSIKIKFLLAEIEISPPVFSSNKPKDSIYWSNKYHIAEIYLDCIKFNDKYQDV